MARKFKIGDKVRIVKKIILTPFDEGFNTQSKGVVIEYTKRWKRIDLPYVIKNSRCDAIGFFSPKELELIN